MTDKRMSATAWVALFAKALEAWEPVYVETVTLREMEPYYWDGTSPENAARHYYGTKNPEHFM